jgi:hypothetical protein
MRHVRLLRLATLFLIALATHGGATVAAERPNVLIIGADGEQDTVPRHSRVFKGVVDELSAVLQDNGFAVYDEAAITPGEFARGRTRRNDAELIDIARSALRPPVDVAIIFSIHTRAEQLSYTTKVGSQITARLLNVMTGQHLGSFRVMSPRSLRAPLDCVRGCLAEVVERDTRRLSRELGRQLAQRLTSMLGAKTVPYGSPGDVYSGLPTAYALVFEGFSDEEVFEIEEYLVVFSGYQRHRPISTGRRRHEYWYETGSARGRLNRNLSKMLDYLDMPGQVDLLGNVFTVTKTAVVESRAGSWDDW